MLSLKKIWRNYITSGFNAPQANIESNRIIFINIFSLLGFLVEFSFGFFNVLDGSYLYAAVETITAIVLLINLIMLRRHHRVSLSARILLVTVAAPLMIMLIGGTMSNTGLFWLPTFPVAAYVLLGKKHGSAALLILFMVIGFIALLESFNLVQIAYSLISIRQVILSLLILTVVLYVHESLKEQDIALADKKALALSKAYKKIKQSEQLRDEFTLALAHELRNALIAIQKISETWHDRIDTTPKERAQEYISLINESATDNLTLVDSLLDIMNIDTADFKINKKLCSLREIVKQQISFFGPQADKAKVKIVSRLDDDVPWQLKLDNFRVKQVLANLLSNAIKHTSAGKEIEVQTIYAVNFEHLMEKGKQLRLNWYLNGTEDDLSDQTEFVFIGISHPEQGIANKDLPKLFKKFSRLQKHDELHPPKGRGLGLYIVKRIIKAHAGICGVSSKTNHGTTFYVTLPTKV